MTKLAEPFSRNLDEEGTYTTNRVIMTTSWLRRTTNSATYILLWENFGGNFVNDTLIVHCQLDQVSQEAMIYEYLRIEAYSRVLLENP
jgi:hypothetical protein